uniref:Uncharacterized protein n=1 Tax=Cacopsylla melanoneura TaxID=428564 RepID=A0A8D8W439_9HEMI
MKNMCIVCVCSAPITQSNLDNVLTGSSRKSGTRGSLFVSRRVLWRYKNGWLLMAISANCGSPAVPPGFPILLKVQVQSILVYEEFRLWSLLCSNFEPTI